MNKIKFRKPSDTISSTDSTLESILSAGEIPKMELLKINYVNFSNPPDPSKVAQRRLPSERIEDQKHKRQSLDGYFNRKLFSSSTNNTSDSSNNAEKSNSWDYRTKNISAQGTIDIAVSGHRSRANRIANIEKIACEHERNKEEKLKNAKSCSDVSRINKLFEVAKKTEHRGEKVKRLSENFECICTTKHKSNSLRFPLKTTQLSEFSNSNICSSSSNNSDNSKSNSNAKINEKIRKIFEIPAPPSTPPSPVILPKNIKQYKKNNDRVHARKKQRQSLLIGDSTSNETNETSKNSVISQQISIFDRGVNFSTHNNSCSILIKADDEQQKKTIKENNLKNSEQKKRFSIILPFEDEESCKNKKLDIDEESKLQTTTTTTIYDLNDVQNFSNKNLIKITTDEVMAQNHTETLNNTVPKNTKKISIGGNKIEDRTFNDLKDQQTSNNSVKIFVRNPSFSAHSISSSSTLSTSSSCTSSNSTSNTTKTAKLLSDCGYYDRVTEPRNSMVSSTEEEEYYDECNCSDEEEDEGVGAMSKRSQKSMASIQTISSSSCSSSKDLMGCDVGGDGVFWNNCYFYDDNYCCSNYSICDDDNCTYFIGECCNEDEEINRKGCCCNKRGGFKVGFLVLRDFRFFFFACR